MRQNILRFLFATFTVAALYLINETAGFRNAVLMVFGIFLALALLWGRLGFTSAWRHLIVAKSASPIIKQILLLWITSLFVLPILMNVPDTIGNIAPVGFAMFFGAFLFGIGMQLGDGCGSGTLIASGSGSISSLICLVFFIVGSVAGSLHLHLWLPLNQWDPISLTQLDSIVSVGVLQTLALTFLLLTVIWWSKKKQIQWTLPQKQHLLAILSIALLVSGTLFISGRMWGITFGYTLWGAKIGQNLGLDLKSVPFWQWSFPQYSLENSITADVTSVMNIGLILGSGWHTLFKPLQKISIDNKQMHAAILGGLLMGYGARLAFGCNIGAYFSGIASGSLHGWMWLIFAFVGSIFGTKMRPYFRLAH